MKGSKGRPDAFEPMKGYWWDGRRLYRKEDYQDQTPDTEEGVDTPYIGTLRTRHKSNTACSMCGAIIPVGQQYSLTSNNQPYCLRCATQDQDQDPEEVSIE